VQAETFDPYPVDLSVDYEGGERNRLTVGLRIFTVIPIAVVLSVLTAQSSYGYWGIGAGGMLFFPTLLMLLFRNKYPGWWFDWNLNLVRFANRVVAYFFILRDDYPSTDEEQAVHVSLPDPRGGGALNRWLPLVKWFLAIPHYFVLAFLYIAALLLSIVGWFIVLFTGRYPQSFHDFIVGLMRWSVRVQAYSILLVTDRYPPFQLSP
jgi:hypothetical protein